MNKVIEDRDNEIESLKNTIKLLKAKMEVNKLNYALEKENETLREEYKILKKENESLGKGNCSLINWNESFRKENESLRKENESIRNVNEKLSKCVEDYQCEIAKLVHKNATLLTYYNIIKAKTNSYFRELNNIDGDEDTYDLDQWLIDEDLEQKYEDDNQETIEQQNEETKSDFIEIAKDEQTIKEQSNEINNSECFKILQYIHNNLGNFIFL